jgi:hypothetical protein
MKRSLIKNKKGAYGDVFIFLTMAFLIVLFFGLMYWGFGKMNTVLISVDFQMGDGEGYNNFSNIVDATWGEVYDSYDQLKTLSYVLIFGMIITILLGNWLVKAHPIFFVIYLLVSLGAIIVGAYLSNTYMDLLNNADFGSTLASFKGASYFILYLPYLGAVITLIGSVIMFISMNKNKTLNEVPI